MTPALDETRALRDESRRVVAALQARYADETGVKALKIRHNNVLGYFVEVTAQHGDKLMAPPLNATFIHRQTLAGQVRFTTDRTRRAGSQDRQRRRSRARPRAGDLRAAVGAVIGGQAPASRQRAEALARARCRRALWRRSPSNAIMCGREVDDALAFAIEGGRHPVVEQALRATARRSSPMTAISRRQPRSECERGGRIWLLTGPNMAGKSTFLRQNALIAMLAQMGSFVPAKRARIGIVDRLFSRVGAADDLARGRSTFMVEMVETAAILNQASERVAGDPGRDRPRHRDLRRSRRSPGRRSSICTRSTAAARCSRRISTS